VTRHGAEGRPQFPLSPEGLVRIEHLPTVEACICYWEAIRVQAILARNPALEWTAIGLRSSYEQAREQLERRDQLGKRNLQRTLD
jgi:hypothetical protein